MIYSLYHWEDENLTCSQVIKNHMSSRHAIDFRQAEDNDFQKLLLYNQLYIYYSLLLIVNTANILHKNTLKILI